MPKNKCKICGSALSDRRKRYCSACKYFCSDCGKEITGRGKSGLCRSCLMKQKWEDGHFRERRREALIRCWDNRRLPPRFCFDCGEEISNQKSRGEYPVRCKRCAGINRWARGGKHLRTQQVKRNKEMWETPGFKTKHSERMRAFWQEDEFRARTLGAMREANSSVSHCRAISMAKKRDWANGVYDDVFYGENNPSWNGGTSFELYGPEFNDSLRKYVRNRDGHICAICEESEHVDGHSISVHHINYNKKDNDPINLIALCGPCHSKTNFNRKFWPIILAPIARHRENHLARHISATEKVNHA